MAMDGYEIFSATMPATHRPASLSVKTAQHRLFRFSIECGGTFYPGNLRDRGRGHQSVASSSVYFAIVKWSYRQIVIGL